MKRTMLRRSDVLCVGLALGGATAFGQTVYVAPAGTGTPAQGQMITAKGGDVLTLEVWVQGIPKDKLKEFRATMPCAASGGAAGSINYPAGVSPIVYDGIVNSPVDPDYVFSGITHITSGASAGKCPSGNLSGYPSAIRGVSTLNAVRPLVPKYLATFTYNVSTDAQGTFTVQAQSDPSTCPAAYGSYLLKGITTATCYPTTYTPALTINVPTGRCCKNEGCTLACSDGVTQYACQNTIGGVFTEGGDCSGAPPCPCQGDSHCADGTTCTRDVCSSGTCSNPSDVVYADIYPCGGNGIIDIDDLLQMLDAFAGLPSPCPACDGSGGACGAARAAAGGPGVESAKISSLSSAQITLSADKAVGERGKLFQVDVYASDVVHLRSYHIGVEVTGGRSGHLDLESVSVDRQRPDYVFPGQESVVLLVDKARKTLDVIQLDGQAAATGRVYLGTFSFRPSAEAHGRFQVDLQPQDGATLTMFRNKTVVPERSTAAAILIR